MTDSLRNADTAWQVLVLHTDDACGSEIKGIWGPYTDDRCAAEALAELRRWPLEGYWETRRINKWVAAKAGNPPNSLRLWSWR